MELPFEKRLIARAQRGDMRAYEQLYRAHKDALYHRVIRPRVRTDADAEDVLVESFVTALRKLDQFQWQGRSLFGWLARIAVNTCHDLGRLAAREERRRIALVARDLTPPPRPDDVVERLSDRERARTQIAVVLDELRPRYALALRFRLLEDLPRSECAQMLEVSVATFDVVLLRAVLAFRKLWAARFSEDEGGF